MHTIRCVMHTSSQQSVPMTLAVASTPLDRTMGYKAVHEPRDDGEGILFFFPEPTASAFNMRGVPFDLDLCVGGEHGQVLGGCAMTANSPEEYQPRVPIRFAVEMKAGWSRRNGKPTRLTLP